MNKNVLFSIIVMLGTSNCVYGVTRKVYHKGFHNTLNKTIYVELEGLKNTRTRKIPANGYVYIGYGVNDYARSKSLRVFEANNEGKKGKKIDTYKNKEELENDKIYFDIKQVGNKVEIVPTTEAGFPAYSV